jgi:hypothetical protein
MTGLLWRVGSCFVVVVTSLLLCADGRVLADDRPAIDITGHWASPLEASGIDLVQSGSSVRGSSLSGLDLSGTIDGRRVEFIYWDGRSYAKADREDRGTGVMVVAKTGQRAKVTWRSDKKKAPEEGSFVMVRVGPPDEDVWTPALEDGLVVSPGASPGSGPSLEEEADDLHNEVIGPSETPAAVSDTDTLTYPTSEPVPPQPLEGWDADEIWVQFYDQLSSYWGIWRGHR